MSSKTSVSKEEMAYALWQLCCDLADKFSAEHRPEYRHGGFLSRPGEDTNFMLESIILHLWVIVAVLGDRDRDLLDLVHNYFTNWNPVAARTLGDRYDAYHEANSQDKELHAKGLPPLKLSRL